MLRQLGDEVERGAVVGEPVELTQCGGEPHVLQGVEVVAPAAVVQRSQVRLDVGVVEHRRRVARGLGRIRKREIRVGYMSAVVAHGGCVAVEGGAGREMWGRGFALVVEEGDILFGIGFLGQKDIGDMIFVGPLRAGA